MRESEEAGKRSTIDLQELNRWLRAQNGRPYPAYRDLGALTVVVSDHVGGEDGTMEISFPYLQGDPFAAPSIVRVVLSPARAGLPEWAVSSASRAVAAATFLCRRAALACDRYSSRSGSGRSGLIAIDRPGQQVLRRTSLQVNWEGGVDLRLRVGLPGRGRRIAGDAAAELLCKSVMAIAAEVAFRPGSGEADGMAGRLRLAVETNEDAEALRAQLGEQGLVAFLADGSRLARASGVDDSPLEGEGSVPLRSPQSLRRTLVTPNAGEIVGMGIPEGVTLVVGGGFHGKSTLLAAIGDGVHNHVPGDGREQVVTRADAVRVRAEDGRPVAAVDISPFIRDLPGGVGTSSFSTANASGSTSQAAATVEAIESGSRLLLIDEDTAATNFMVRDQRMQRLVSPDREPIIPFVARVRQLYCELGVSTLLVVGGTGDYFGEADRVIGMDAFRAADLSDQARAIVAEASGGGGGQGDSGNFEAGKGHSWGELPPLGDPRVSRRCPKLLVSGAAGRHGDRSPKLRVRDRARLEIGGQEIDLSGVPQVIDASQTRGIGEALGWLQRREFVDGRTPVGELLDRVEQLLEESGPDGLAGAGLRADLAEFRRQDLAAALNRLRTLAMSEETV